MLTRTEKKIMNIVFERGKSKASVLISPTDIKSISGDKTLNEERIGLTLNNLASDGYFDLVYSDRHGESVYCISLSKKGKGYGRSVKQFRRSLLNRLLLTVGFAVLSFLIGVVLKAIF